MFLRSDKTSSTATFINFDRRSGKNGYQHIAKELALNKLDAKGQLFIISEHSRNEGINKASQLAINIITDSYYSEQGNDICASLGKAIDSAVLALDELLNREKAGQKIKITALVISQKLSYVAYVGESLLYHFSEGNIKRLRNKPPPLASASKRGLKNRIKSETFVRKTINSEEGYILVSDLLMNYTIEKLRTVLKASTSDQIIRGLEESKIEQDVNFQIIKRGARNSNVDKLAFGVIVLVFSLVLFARVFIKKQETVPYLLQPVAIKSKTSQSHVFFQHKLEGVQVPDLFYKQPEPALQNNPVKLTTTTKKSADTPKPLNNFKGNYAPGKPLVTVKSIWTFVNLSASDYTKADNRITFLSSANIKKALYTTKSLRNFSIETFVHIPAQNGDGRIGLILSYRTQQKSPYETFYLLSLYNNADVFLQKYVGFKNALVHKEPIKPRISGNLQYAKLKVNCVGSYIEFFINDRRILLWKCEEAIDGGVGLFASPDINVEFYDFVVTKLSK